MASITFTGRLGQDSTIKFLSNGTPVLEFSVADDKRRKNPSGEWETESTTWWRVSYFGKPAEAAADVLLKGVLVRVEGTVFERKFEHQGADRSAYDVKATQVSVVPVAKSSGNAAPSGGFNRRTPGNTGDYGQADPWTTGGGNDDGVPF